MSPVATVAQFEKRYHRILYKGNINIAQNIKEAKNFKLLGILPRPWKLPLTVKMDAPWDYKKHPKLDKGRINDPAITAELLAEFGNVHYGIVAAA